MRKDQLLAVIEDIIRTMPPRAALRLDTVEGVAWFGRASAAIKSWDPTQAPFFNLHLGQFFNNNYSDHGGPALNQLLVMLHQAHHDLRMQTMGPVNVAVPQSMVFGYFEEVRKIIELAKQDVLFVDPYLDAEFVSRFLPHVAAGTAIRLLARGRLATLLPAVDLLAKQEGRKIEVRSAPKFHDRYILIDGISCYQSGASFKDGAKSAPTTITQITDAFSAVKKTYEDLWNSAQVER